MENVRGFASIEGGAFLAIAAPVTASTGLPLGGKSGIHLGGNRQTIGDKTRDIARWVRTQSLIGHGRLSRRQKPHRILCRRRHQALTSGQVSSPRLIARRAARSSFRRTIFADRSE